MAAILISQLSVVDDGTLYIKKKQKQISIRVDVK
jgi:hypothetical protein